MRLVYTAGVWDLLHRGHVNILWESKRLGDVLVVGVVSDAGCQAYKGFVPRQNVQQRIRAVRALGFVDVVEMQPTTDPSPLLERYRPDVMTHGDDWTELRQGMETIRRLGIEWRLIPYTPGISSTELRKGNGKTRDGLMLGANP
jgi:cytidyltransferase-like protein